jgi:murein L,D-transpeptidase YcbB/YkuD
MKRALLISLLSVPVLACSHPRTASDATQAASADEQAQGGAESAQASEEQSNEESRAHTKQGGSSAKPREAGTPAQAGAQEPEVATSARGLYKPGAEEKVREKLGINGDSSTRGPLQRFQREHGLPATGMLDHETAKRLGLDPDDIFESTQAP